MHIGKFVLVFCICFSCYSDDFVQSPELRDLCKIVQNAEREEKKLRRELDEILKEERISAPVTRNIYNMLTNCFTLLFTIQRFHEVLALNQENNKNDFIRAGIVIKNFSAYFHNVSDVLSSYRKNRLSLHQRREERESKIKTLLKTKKDANAKIKELSVALAEKRPENSIRNDVVYHIAGKSESIEELDAELEAENTVGVLRNTKIATELKLALPVAGKIVSEFGDRAPDDKMVYYLAFETLQGAVVTSPAKGLVVFAGNFLNYDNMVIISNGEYRIFIYGIDKLFVVTGDVVEIGDYLGKMKKNSVDSPILKLELKKSGESLDPRHWLSLNLEEQEKKQ